MAEVEAVGALNWDRILFADRFAERGEEVALNDVQGSIGGSAANTASWLADRREVGFNGYVGNDVEGRHIEDALESAGIDTSNVETEEGRSGAAFIVSEEGERTIYVNDGVNKAPEKIPNAELVHMASFFRYDALETQARVAKETDAATSFAPGFLCYDAPDRLPQVLEHTDLLFVNEVERDALGSRADPVETVVVTLGEEGCRVETGEGTVTVPALEAEVVDATGAGDAFAAGYVDAYLEGASPDEAGRRGNEVAARCLRSPGGFND